MKNANLQKQASFSAMTEGTAADYTIIAEHTKAKHLVQIVW